MKRALGLLSALVILSAPLARGDAAEAGAQRPMASVATFPLRWPPLAGWRTETIPFPLGFAPQLRYTGVEELRFAPGFGKPGEPQYFTYAFVWVIGANEVPDRQRLESDLKRYFDGLMTAVARERKLPTKAIDTSVTVTAQPPAPVPDGGRPLLYTATIKTFDAFFTRAALSLQVEVRDVRCPLPGRRALYFSVAPDLASVRQPLAAVQQQLACP